MVLTDSVLQGQRAVSASAGSCAYPPSTMATTRRGGCPLPTPTIPLIKMTATELRSKVAQLVRCTTRRTRGPHPQRDEAALKPAWWPRAVPFTGPRHTGPQPASQQGPDRPLGMETMRQLIKTCYRHYRQEALLVEDVIENDRQPERASDRSTRLSAPNAKPSKSVSFEDKDTEFSMDTEPTSQYGEEAAAPYPGGRGAGPRPAGVFRNVAAMPPESLSDASATWESHRDVQPESRATHTVKSFVEIFICFFCEREFKQKPDLQSHQLACAKRPAELQAALSRPASVARRNSTRLRQAALRLKPFTDSPTTIRAKLFTHPQVSPRVKPFADPQTWRRPSKAAFVEGLALLPRNQAESLRRQRAGSRDVHCDLLEVGEEPAACQQSPRTPTTPRTPRSLMSQLSREASPPARARQRLDLLLDEPSGPNHQDKKREEGSEVSDLDSESGKSEASEGSEHGGRPSRMANLLAIDVTSPLGYRVRKHLNKLQFRLSRDDSPDESTASGEHYEKYCHTPVKNEFLERLRSRGTGLFPVTFKKRRRPVKFVHAYKFSRRQLRAYCRRVETGLNPRSRALRRQMKKCSVPVVRLNLDEVERWGRPRTATGAPSALAARLSVDVSPLRNDTLLHWTTPPKQRATTTTITAAAADTRYPQTMFLLQQPNDQRPSPRPALRSAGSAVGAQAATPQHVTSQQLLLYKLLLSESLAAAQTVTAAPVGSPADLTPPSTPESPIEARQRQLFPAAAPPLHDANAVITIDDDDDVISISSSSDGEAEVEADAEAERGTGVKRRREWSESGDGLGRGEASPVVAGKRRRIDELQPVTLLFRCRLCQEELTCRESATTYIKQHFAQRHQVSNIELVEHLDSRGHKVISIVEVPLDQSSTPSAPPPAPAQPPAQVHARAPKAPTQRPAANKQTPEQASQPPAGRTQRHLSAGDRKSGLAQRGREPACDKGDAHILRQSSVNKVRSESLAKGAPQAGQKPARRPPPPAGRTSTPGGKPVGWTKTSRRGSGSRPTLSARNPGLRRTSRSSLPLSPVKSPGFGGRLSGAGVGAGAGAGAGAGMGFRSKANAATAAARGRAGSESRTRRHGRKGVDKVNREVECKR